MRGYLITNAFMRGGSFEKMRKLFMEAAQKQGVELLSRTNADFMRGVPAGEADFALFYDKDIRLAKRLEMHGLPVFNSADAIAVCDDKTLTHLALERRSCPSPRICSARIPFRAWATAICSLLRRRAKRWAFPW